MMPTRQGRWRCPATVDAGIGSEIHQHHLAAQVGKGQRCRGVSQPSMPMNSGAANGRQTSRRQGTCSKQLWKERAAGLHGTLLAAWVGRPGGAHVDDSLGEIVRRLLGLVVSHAALDQSVLVFARALPGIRRRRFQMRCAVRVALHGDRRDVDDWRLRRPLLLRVILPLAVSETDPPAIVVDDDVDMVSIVDGLRAAIERRGIEIPFRRGRLPDEPGEGLPLLFIADPASAGREIELVPPCEFRLGR